MSYQDTLSFSAARDYIVREATPSDAHEALMSFKQVRQESPYLLLQWDEGIQNIKSQARQFEKMAIERNQVVMFAWHAESLVGFVGMSRGAFHRNRHVANLAMAVKISHQCLGIGSSLLTSALAWAHNENVKRVELCVAAENLGALRLYERYGFVAEGIKRDSFLLNGKLVDEHMMSYLLPRP